MTNRNTRFSVSANKIILPEGIDSLISGCFTGIKTWLDTRETSTSIYDQHQMYSNETFQMIERCLPKYEEMRDLYLTGEYEKVVHIASDILGMLDGMSKAGKKTGFYTHMESDVNNIKLYLSIYTNKEKKATKSFTAVDICNILKERSGEISHTSSLLDEGFALISVNPAKSKLKHNREFVIVQDAVTYRLLANEIQPGLVECLDWEGSLDPARIYSADILKCSGYYLQKNLESDYEQRTNGKNSYLMENILGEDKRYKCRSLIN